jgi:phenylacetate-CoA ligase
MLPELGSARVNYNQAIRDLRASAGSGVCSEMPQLRSRHKSTMRRSPSAKPLRPLSPFLAWPVFLAKQPFSLRAIVHGLEGSQWEPAAALAAGQRAQRRLLLEWAVNHVPHYRKAPAYAEALAIIRPRPDDIDAQWGRLPILGKAEVRALGRSLDATTLPAGHAPVEKIHTSGSTGIPVEVGTTALARAIWGALTIRDHLWHRRDFSKRLGVVRALKKEQRHPGGVDLPSWGNPVAALFSTGPSSAIHVGNSIGEIATWLKRFDPHYLLTYPSVAATLMDEIGGERPPALEEVRLFAEPLDPELEQRLASQWQVRCTDVYSANEVGYIALQCAEHGSLHIQAEAVFVEILDEAGNVCGVGDSGRVVVTSLQSLATPLLRYELGDYGTVGPPCPCGRASPVVERVLGRVRNMARTPDGRRFYPAGMTAIRAVAPVRQAQYVQTAIDHIDLRVVLDRPLADAEREQAIAFVRRVLGYPFDVGIVVVERIERGPTGKFEEFLSRLPGEPA